MLTDHINGAMQQISTGHVFLSWAGQVYGPATEADVIAGIRASCFESGTLYWHEGLDEWRDLSLFPADLAHDKPAPATPLGSVRLLADSSLHRPTAPGKPSKEREKSMSQPIKAERLNTLNWRGMAFVAGFAFTAVLLTVGILFLLMLV